ncbi:unnamed protein product [Urochloa humidicola]
MHPALLLLLLVTSSLLLHQTRASADCEPAACGNLTLRYPFWLGSMNQTSSPCGHPDFEVWCSGGDDGSVASLKGSNLHVHAINYTNNSFIASHTRVATGDDGVCHTDLNMSVTIALSPFKISSSQNRALCFLYDCNGTEPRGAEYVNVTSNCGAPIYAYLGGAYYWDKPPAIATGRCKYSYIPVLGSEATAARTNYSRLLKDGFMLEWETAGIGDCTACNASGGQCRYDNASAAFRCSGE